MHLAQTSPAHVTCVQGVWTSSGAMCRGAVMTVLGSARKHPHCLIFLPRLWLNLSVDIADTVLAAMPVPSLHFRGV